MQRHTPRSILVAGPVLAGVIGLAYRFGDPIRTSNPTFDVAREMAPMSTWGWMFLAGAVAMTVALVTHNQLIGAYAYFIGGVMYAWWASCFAIQGLVNPEASLVAWALYGAISGNHFLIAYRCWINR